MSRFPDPPYYFIDKHGCTLELGGSGSYDACQQLLRELEQAFAAVCTLHLESGHHPEHDKEKGYWNIEMLGQQFFLMRHRGFGQTLWLSQGTSPDAFLQVARHFGATEHKSTLQKLLAWLPFSNSPA